MDNKVCLVTGSSRGLGAEMALAFARHGYRVGVHYRSRRADAQKTAEEIQRSGSEALLLAADVSRPAQVRRMFRKILSAWGRLDVLVNNAGITVDRFLWNMTDSEWRSVLDVNLNGAFWCLRAAARIMMRRRDGAILNISSIIGVRGSVGTSNYAASKAGLIGLTKAAARELGRFNIRVNAILPGFHLTEMGRQVWGKHSERIQREHVLGRLTDRRELAEFVVFIAEQKSASGQVFNFESRVI